MEIIKWLISQYFRWKNTDPIMKYANKLLWIGGGLFIPSLGLFLQVSFEIINFPFDFKLSPQVLTFSNTLGTLCILVSIGLVIFRLMTINGANKTIIILHRGMSGMNIASPEKSLPSRYKNPKPEYINIPDRSLDIKNQYEDIKVIPRDIRQRIDQIDHNSVSVLYCGLAPIPLLFFAGYMLQKREKIEIMDYHRSSQKWLFLDDLDDKESLVITSTSKSSPKAIAVALGFSFDVNLGLIRRKLGDEIKIVSVSLEDGARMDSMQSNEKQNRILKELTEAIAKLRSECPDISVIHVFMAVQASFAVNFGSYWTTSVLPPVRIYNYDAGSNSYAWDIEVSHETSELNFN